MPTERPAAETPDITARIIEAATCLFVASGYRGISMREIAEAVGISKAGLYYHFRDKEDLFLAILTANLDTVEKIILDARCADTSTRARVTQIIRGIFSLSPDQRAIIRLASQEMVHVSRETRASFEGVYHRRFLGQIQSVLEAGIERGELRAVDTRLATWLLLGMAYPFFYPNHPLGDASETVELLVSVFFDGLSGLAGSHGAIHSGTEGSLDVSES
jgi:AcrR family transcriptional regulator